MQIAAAFIRWQRRDGVPACHHLNGEGARGSPLNGVGMWQRVEAAWAERAPMLTVETIRNAESEVAKTHAKLATALIGEGSRAQTVPPAK